jgi:hypothetical protein
MPHRFVFPVLPQPQLDWALARTSESLDPLERRARATEALGFRRCLQHDDFGEAFMSFRPR